MPVPTKYETSGHSGWVLKADGEKMTIVKNAWYQISKEHDSAVECRDQEVDCATLDEESGTADEGKESPANH